MGKLDIPLEDMISRITEQVISQLRTQQQPIAVNTIVMLPSFVPNPQKLQEYLAHHQKGRAEYFSLSSQDEEASPVLPPVSPLPNPSLLLHKVFSSDNLVVVAPSVGLMTNIVRLSEQSICEQVIFKALLWGKKITFLTDFSTQQKGNAFYTQIADLLDQLTRMGIEVASYLSGPSAKGQGLITESEIIALHSAGQTSIVLSEKTIVTPLAWDKARELGIEILL